jgi:TetR/AcrR family transcriptional repressor of bet genes
MARPKNTETRREQIVDGLLWVMAAKGYDRASIAEIAKAGRLTPGLVHYHFGSKQEILIAAVGRLAAGLGRRIEKRSLKAAPRPLPQLDAFIDAHLALGVDANPKAVATWVMLGAEAVRQREVREVFAKVLERNLERLDERVRAVLREQGARADRSGEISAALFAAIQGYFTLASTAPALTPPGTAADAVKVMARGLLRGGKS